MSSDPLHFYTSSRVFHWIQPFRRSCIHEGGKGLSPDGVHRQCEDSSDLNVGRVTGLGWRGALAPSTTPLTMPLRKATPPYQTALKDNLTEGILFS